jgi:hypothetical protein
MMPVQTCSICNGPIVGFGNNAQPVNDGRCCDRCYSETVVPERVRRGARARCQARRRRRGAAMTSGIIALIVGFAAGYGRVGFPPPTPSG